MKIALLTGTSHVATELCFLFREQGHDVIPAAQSRVSASFLNHHGFDPRIVDVEDRSSVKKAVGDADIVVVTAFARQYSRGFKPKEARAKNDAIIRNAIDSASAGATIVYFSTIAIYGDEVGFSRFDSYAREKRRVEKLFLKSCEKHNKSGYVFRIGPVYGSNQKNSQRIRSRIRSGTTESGTLHIAIGRDHPSNVTHSVTLADAILTCDVESFSENIYTVVNHPEWTWGEVFEYYAPKNISLTFHPKATTSVTRKYLSSLANVFESRERALRSLLPYLPARANDRIFNEYIKKLVGNDLREFNQRFHVELSQFNQDRAPGMRLPGLTPTKQLLDDQEQILTSVFENHP